jgi:hypothetical protein
MWHWYCYFQTKILSSVSKSQDPLSGMYDISAKWQLIIWQLLDSCLSFYAFFLLKMLRGRVMKLSTVIWKQAQAWSSLLLELCVCLLSVCKICLYISASRKLHILRIDIHQDSLPVVACGTGKNFGVTLLYLTLEFGTKYRTSCFWIPCMEPVVSESHVWFLWILI